MERPQIYADRSYVSGQRFEQFCSVPWIQRRYAFRTRRFPKQVQVVGKSPTTAKRGVPLQNPDTVAVNNPEPVTASRTTRSRSRGRPATISLYPTVARLVIEI